MPVVILAVVIGVPILELYVILQVGAAIGALWTVAALVATSLIGVRLVRSQGRAVLRDFAGAVAAGRPPAREALDGVLVLVGGVLLIVPGFVTDVIGALLLAPPTRALARGLIVRHYAGRLVAYLAGAGAGRRMGSQVYDVDGRAIEVDPEKLRAVSDAVTVGFGDGAVAGVVRGDAGALLWREGRTSTVAAARLEPAEAGAGWRASADGELDVALEPLGAPAAFADGTREWLCRARGTAGGADVDCLGHAVVEADPTRARQRSALVRGVGAWLSDELAIAVRARRPARARNHEAEELTAFILRGSPPEPQAIADPRLSTAYDGDGRQRRAGLELWETEDSEFAVRLAGESVGGGEIELPGGSRLRCAFFVWRHAGRVGAGRYDILLAGD